MCQVFDCHISTCIAAQVAVVILERYPAFSQNHHPAPFGFPSTKEPHSPWFRKPIWHKATGNCWLSYQGYLAFDRLGKGDQVSELSSLSEMTQLSMKRRSSNCNIAVYLEIKNLYEQDNEELNIKRDDLCVCLTRILADGVHSSSSGNRRQWMTIRKYGKPAPLIL